MIDKDSARLDIDIEDIDMADIDGLPQNDAPTILDPLAFPLHGSRLIEASAGTGKTYTIAALYLRLVLGHGSDEGTAYARPLTPPEILVVTFTDAATKELRDRIRSRLAEAAAYFLSDPDEVTIQPGGQDLLYDLRETYPAERWPLCARKLQLAAEWMDEAAVSTIHGWCNRMLHEHAFDSNSLFTQQLETDQSDLLAEVVRDYWRTHLYPLDRDDVATLLAWWKAPEMLQTQLRRLLSHTAAIGQGQAPAEAIGAAREAAASALSEIKAPWRQWIGEIETLLDEAVAAKQVVGSKIQKRFYGPWLAILREWVENPSLVEPGFKGDAAWKRLCVTGIAEGWKEGHVPPVHPAFEAMTTLRERLAQLPDAREAILCHATWWVDARFHAEQERRAQMGFDDLLTRLDRALQGPGGERLAELIRRQFPVAMIDEFQDTDPVQYRIFDAIYRVADNAPGLALILIGDPKQAIYAFRGADIHTYLTARRDTGKRHYTLGTNFRSTLAMVSATNHLFERAERRVAKSGRQSIAMQDPAIGRATSGAFLFKHAHGNALPFVPVAARGRRQEWTIDATPEPALTAWYLDEGSATYRGHYVQYYAAVCAGEIARLLRLGLTGRAGFTDTDAAHFAALTPGDIAVLVNTGSEAQAVRHALSARGVRSVYLSDKESVFESASAAELQRWLAACAAPDDDRLLRAALATPALGLDWGELDRLNNDEMAWEARIDQFRDYRQCWRRQGVLPMLRRLMHDFAVPGRLLAHANERALTDLLHLAELLQQASSVLDGEHALIRHLAEQRDAAGDENDVRKLRLESDADLVKVVTVHKSKGLEYPLVFLPFAAGFRTTKAVDLPLKWHDETERLQIGLRADDTVLAAADHERLGEDLRKLYVALTRARYATWIGLAPLDELHRSGLGYLIGGGEPILPGALASLLMAVSEGCDAVAVVPAPEPDGFGTSVDTEASRADGADSVADSVIYSEVAEEAPLLPPRRMVFAAREPWWIASYSALKISDAETEQGLVVLPEAPETASQEVFAEAGADLLPLDAIAQDASPGSSALTESSASSDREPGKLHAFPRGPNPGTFLHGILEWAGREGFARVLSEPARARDMIARVCNVRGWQAWINPLTDWLMALLDQPLMIFGQADQGDGSHFDDAAVVRLGALNGYQVEMEFWYAIDSVDTRALDRLITAQTLAGVARPALLANHLNGMLKGFIDLVFEHKGRFYVVDYKSNFLGASDADYHRTAMEVAVLGKRYDLQFVIYIFALHRLLRSRLRDYDYEVHVGGAIYMFLRGTGAGNQGLFCERPAVSLINALDQMFSSKATGEVASAVGVERVEGDLA